MIEADRLIEPVASIEDEGVDRAIRPKMLARLYRARTCKSANGNIYSSG